MSDQLSKVDKPAPNWCPRCHKRPDDVTFCTHAFHRIESDAAPVEVDVMQLQEQARAWEAVFSTLSRIQPQWHCSAPVRPSKEMACEFITTLARQLAEAREVHEAFAGDAARRLNEMESSLAAATRRVGEVEGLVGKWRQRSKIEASAAREFDDPDEMAWHEGKAAQLDESADELEAELTKEPTK